MRGDGYLPGALVLAYALKMQTTHDCICLVTSDVSEMARQALGYVYDKVIQINEIHHKSGISQGRQDRNVLMTRFEALRLGPDGGLADYDKIVLLDADVLPIWGYDDLFSLATPAGIIMEHKNECYQSVANQCSKNAKTQICSITSATTRWSWHSLYEPICPHGTAIPKEITNRARNDTSNMGVNSGLWVLTPSLQEYEAVISSLQTTEVAALVKSFPWPEMQLATLLWSGRWTNIDIRYCSIGGYPKVDALYGIHFAGLKPWQIRNRSAQHYAKFPDFTLWRQFYTSLYWQTPALRKIPALQRLWAFFSSITS